MAEDADNKSTDLPGVRPSGANGLSSSVVGQSQLEGLPIFAHREAILEHVRTYRVTHIQGETGCGKSTQVPKYVMEDAIKHGEEPKIVVTQPRRMAAVSLARRCAAELGEEIGKTVGYKISGDSVSGKLCFATTGFLLQVLVNQPEEFGTYSHIILDEVHERSVDADLLTMLLRLLMQCYIKVKLIVMSATLQAEVFARYFASLEGRYLDQGPVEALPVKPLFVGVRTFPVDVIFLDELEAHFQIAGGQARHGLEIALEGFSKGGKAKGKSKGKKGDRGIDGAASGFLRSEPKLVEGLDWVCKELVQQMAQDKCTLVVFLPGIADITAFYETLSPLESREQGRGLALRIFAMHSMIPREEQEEVFRPPPAGTCHVVLASNVAESSLTLPSVSGVIDMSLRRSLEYDPRRLISCLVTTWCSQSSCKQRSGRAGRTMPGRAVRMVTRAFFEDEMIEFDPPDMLSAPLTKLFLQAKQLCIKLKHIQQKGIIPKGIDVQLTSPTVLLKQLVSPPATELVEAAITELSDVGAVDSNHEEALITPLGHICMAIPCELRLCRLIYFGLMLNCAPDAIAMVAAITAADPFAAPTLLLLKDEREYCRKLERSFDARLRCDAGRHSEPLMLRELFMHWVDAGAPRGKAMGPFSRTWNVVPKKLEAVATEAVDLSTRLLKLLKPGTLGHTSVQHFLATMCFKVDPREEITTCNFPSDSVYSKLFCQDIKLMRALLALSFSDQLLFHLKPRWDASCGKKRKEEQMVARMAEQKLDYSGTVCIMQPPTKLRDKGDEDATQENIQRLCQALCGEAAKRTFWDDWEKVLYLDFVGKKKGGPDKARQGPENILNDALPQVHRCHQFSAGRWRFNVECLLHAGGSESEEVLEIVRPIQPFLLTWDVLQCSERSEGEELIKKPGKVQAMPDWRNPLGFACDVRPELTPAREHLAVCASIQGLESGQTALVAGVTVLGMNYFPFLLPTLDPGRWKLQWGFNGQTHEIHAVRLLHMEIQLPPETITGEVLRKSNILRTKIREALLPADVSKGGKGSNASASVFLNIPDMRREMADFLDEIWDEPYPVRQAKRISWGHGAEDACEAPERLPQLRPLEDTLCEVNEVRLTKKQIKEQNKALLAMQQKEAARRPPAEPPEYVKKSELKVGDRASLNVKYGDHKGQYAVRIVGIEEKGLKIQHEKDGYEEVVKQRDIKSGKLSIHAAYCNSDCACFALILIE
ncbi:spn-E [Symbiodinium sp. CCMP2456]|nr:spn-E [Symbiodinium sp. CCMP2456]